MADVAVVNVALLGCGRGGTELAHLVAADASLEIRRFVDFDAEAAERLARDHGSADWSEDPNDAFRRDDVAAVLIATRPDSHFELALRAAEAGKHLLVEPPLALRYPDAVRVQRACAAAGVVGALDFPRRLGAAVQLVKSRIPGPVIVSLHATTNSLARHWEGEAAYGGVLAAVGAECLDTICHLVGSAPARVHASGGRFVRRAGLPDSYAAAIRFANGALAQAVIGEFGTRRRASAWWGSVTDGSRVASLWDGLGAAEVTEAGHTIADVASNAADRAAIVHAFAVAVGGGGRPRATVHDGVRTAQLADAIYESMGTGSAVDVSAAAPSLNPPGLG